MPFNARKRPIVRLLACLMLLCWGGCAGGKNRGLPSSPVEPSRDVALAQASTSDQSPASNDLPQPNDSSQPAPVRLTGVALQAPKPHHGADAPHLPSPDGSQDMQHDMHPQHDMSRPSPVGRQFVPPPPVPNSPHPLSDYGTVAPAGESEPLQLADVESLACQNNPTLLQAQAQVQGTLGEAIQAGLWPNPTLTYVGEQIGVEGTPGEFQGGIVRQRIVTGRKLELSRQKYIARTRVAEWMALAQQYRVLNDVRIHYFRSRGRQELLAIRRELLKNAEDHVVTKREMYNVGQANRAAIHQANVVLQQHRLEVLMAENEYRLAFEELIAIVGADLAPVELATPLVGDLAPIDWNEALARLLHESPQIMAARNKLDADRITVRREIVQPVPDIVVEGGAGYNFEADDTTATASIAVDVPIFDWNQGTIRQAEADYARQQGEVRRTELLLRRDLARRYGTYLTALQHVRNYQEVILPESRRAYELLLESYQDDRAPWEDVLAAEERYFMHRGEYVSHLISWRESEALIMGYLLHDGLGAPTNPTPPGHINSVPKPR